MTIESPQGKDDGGECGSSWGPVYVLSAAYSTAKDPNLLRARLHGFLGSGRQ